ncbi:MAG TPA: gamma-glutamyl-gamma-aminobutyrate hydrolase family protein [Terriglobia bacterium]|nr:gamma-glutamyl-gamma-aminobutyrate hydrolase family protein [Terriglobia bacterium]
MKIALSLSEKEKAKGKDSPYFKALVAAGAKTDEIELVDGTDSQSLDFDAVDGVLFTGGEDVDPALYGEKKKFESVHASPLRDAFELRLLDNALARRLPILGICRGIQMINVKFGGTLYQDLKSEMALEIDHKQAEPRPEPTHVVTLTDPDSHLGQAFEGSCRVNSLHHQAIKRLGRKLKVTAHSEDGLVEAVEAADDYPFLVAVQWHPEEMVDRLEQRRIFEQFLANCRESAGRRGKK